MDHAYHGRVSSGGGKKAIIAAFLANLAIAVAKLVGFLLTGSSSMLAESVHSLADTGNQGLLLLGGRRAEKHATRQHPFGYGRERYFWSFIVALVLFSAGGVFAIFEGVEKILHPHALESVPVAIVILVVAIAAETFSFRTALAEAAPERGDASLWQFVRRSKRPELPVVVLEDLAALIGLCLALVAVGVAEVTGQPRWDGVGTAAIGVVLVAVAVVLAIEMKSLLIGEAATVGTEDQIVAVVEGHPEVVRVIHLRSEHLGPDELLVGVKVEFTGSLDVAHLADAVNQVEAAVRAQVPSVKHLYVEPDVTRPDHEPHTPPDRAATEKADPAGRH